MTLLSSGGRVVPGVRADAGFRVPVVVGDSRPSRSFFNYTPSVSWTNTYRPEHWGSTVIYDTGPSRPLSPAAVTFISGAIAGFMIGYIGFGIGLPVMGFIGMAIIAASAAAAIFMSMRGN